MLLNAGSGLKVCRSHGENLLVVDLPSDQFNDRFSRDGPHPGHFGDNCVKHAVFQRIMQRDGHKRGQVRHCAAGGRGFSFVGLSDSRDALMP